MKTFTRSFGLVAIFLCVEFVDELVDGTLSAAWPLVQTEFQLTYTDIGLLLSVPVFVAHIIEPIVGLLGDIWRRYWLIVLGGLAFSASLLLFASATSFWGLMLALVLFYPASGTFVALSQATLMDETTEGDHERRMVWWTFSGYLGVAVGPLIVAALLWAGVGWRPALWAIAGAAFIAALTLWLLKPTIAEDEPTPTLAEALRTIRQALRSWRVMRWLVLLSGIDLVLETLIAFVALYLVAQGASPSFAAIAVTVWTLSALSGEFGVGVLLKRVDGLSIMRAGALLMLGALPAFLLVPDLFGKVVLLGVIGLLGAGWYSISIARYYREMEGQTGVAMALSSALGPLQGLVPLAMGALAEAYGIHNALWIVLLAPLSVLVLVPGRQKG